ncbi:MAG: YidC/Oxa1 family membrane protein insertase [Dorea sp.]
MTASLLTAANWPIVGQICWVLGKVMNFIYNFLDSTLPSDNGLVGLSIIIYTIIVYMCMLPMTINQQKTSRLNAVMNPEIKAIQKKYANKKDQASQMKQSEEMQRVYDKYGVSMMGGCLPLLIQMPFLFALYPVIYNIENYVPAIATAPEEVNRFLSIPSLTVTPMEMVKNSGSYGIPAAVIIITAIALPVLSAATQFGSIKLSQALSGQQIDKNDQMAQTMNTMNTTMPLLSLFMVATLPTGIGIYWIFSAVVRCTQQIFINKHLKKMSIEELIEKNKEKAEKKAAKRKENADKINEMAQMNAKNMNTKSGKSSISSKEREERLNKAYANASKAKEGSLASKANMVKKYNESKK